MAHGGSGQRAGPGAALGEALVLGFALALAAASPARGGSLSCQAESFADLDREQLAVVRARVDDLCDCADFDGVSPGGRAGDYKRCVKSVVQGALEASELRKQCGGLLRKTYARSVCGAKPGRVACVKKKVRGGKTSCSVAEEARCADKPGKYSARACLGARNCTEAADSDGDFRISAADDGSCASPDPQEQEAASAGELALVEPDPRGFAATASDVVFELTGAELDASQVTVALNGAVVTPQRLELSAQGIRLLGPLEPGRNEVTVDAADTGGALLFAHAVLWAGDATLEVNVLSPGGGTAATAEVVARLADDPNVRAEAATVGGSAVLSHLPPRTILLEGSSPDGAIGTAGAVAGEEPDTTLQLIALAAPSPIDNNDFSLGTDGWDLRGHAVTLAPHQLESSAARSGGLPRGVADQDLTLTTEAEGPVTISRSFTPTPGTRSIKVRFRFVTSEVPGGYFGTEFNDYFSVSIRTSSGASIPETNSMNGLGLGAFDESGATEWREATLSPVRDGDTVQVDVTVANVSDDQLPSSVVVDFVEEGPLAITELDLRDIDGGPLTHLSAAPHGYFSGVAPIHGTVTVEGPEGEELAELKLEVIQGGSTAATAELSQVAEPQLLETFPSSEELRIPATIRLFDLGGGGLDTSENGTVRLKAVARLPDGTEATREFPSAVPILDHWTGGNRFTARDPGEGGDDWVKPSVRNVAVPLGLRYGDFSNMHGGPFVGHASHRTGNDIDVWFPGYNARNAGTARTILSHLNNPRFGSSISMVFVTFAQTAADPFWQAIRNETLLDGRRAQDVIRPAPDHETHGHYRIPD